MVIYTVRKANKLTQRRWLVSRWGVDHKKYLITVRMTTQRGVTTYMYPSLTQRFPTNDRMMRYRRLPHNVFTDTMCSEVKSKMGNTCAQVFCTNFGWTRVHPLKTKDKAHEALSLIF